MAPDPRTALADGPLPLRIGWPGGWHGSGLEIPLRATGRLQAQWWPLPAAEDRPWLEALLAADDLLNQLRLSEALAEAVDRCVRERLQRPTAKEPKPAPSRRRQTLPEAWLRALRTVDAAIATSADASTQAALLAGSAPGCARGWRPAVSCSCACVAMNLPMVAAAAGPWSCCCDQSPIPAC